MIILFFIIFILLLCNNYFYKSETIYYKGGIKYYNGGTIKNKLDLQIYVINMKKSNDRRQHIKKILNNYNYEFIDAIDGKKLDKLIFNNILKNTIRPMSHGEVGIFLSQKKLFETFLKSNNKYCLVLEDDISLHKNFLDQLNKCLSEIPQFDIFYCYHKQPHHFYNIIGKDVQQYFPEKWSEKLPLLLDKDYSKHCVLASGHRMGAYGMIISRKAATQFLDKLKTIKTAFDVQINFKDVKENLKIYASKKTLVLHDWKFGSTIQGS